MKRQQGRRKEVSLFCQLHDFEIKWNTTQKFVTLASFDHNPLRIMLQLRGYLLKFPTFERFCENHTI